MIYILLSCLLGFSLYFSKSYIITYAGESSDSYNFLLFGSIFLIIVLLYATLQYIKPKASINKNMNILLKSVYLVYGLIGLYIVVYILILIKRAANYAGAVWEYGQLVITKIASMGEKLQWVNELTEIPPNYLNKLDLTTVNSKKDIITQIKTNLTTSINDITSTNLLIDQKLKTTSIWYGIHSAVTDHYVVILSVIGLIGALYFLPKVFGSDLEFGQLLKAGFKRVSDGFSSLDVISDTTGWVVTQQLSITSHLKTVTQAILSQTNITAATQESITQLVKDISVGTLEATTEAAKQGEATNLAILTLNEAVKDLQELVVTVIQNKT